MTHQHILNRAAQSVLLAACITALIACMHGTGNCHGNLEIPDTIHYFGDLRLNTGYSTHRFWIFNRSEKNLVVLNAEPSCSCMKACYSRDVAVKDDSLWVDVSFDTNEYLGDFSKSVNVRTTLGNFSLRIDGFVE